MKKIMMRMFFLSALCASLLLFTSRSEAGDKWGIACGFVRDAATKEVLNDVNIAVSSTLEKGEQTCRQKQ